LQIVDHHKRNIMFHFEPASLRANFKDGLRRAIINKNLCLGKFSGCARQLGPVLVRQITRADFLGIHPRMRTKHSLHQLFFAHFK